MIRKKTTRSLPPPADCPLEECLRLLAGAWTPKILWYLRSEPRRFGDLKRDLDGVSAKVLTTRLRELEDHDVVQRKVLPTSPPTVEYALTQFGAKLKPVLNSIAEVGKDLKKKSKNRPVNPLFSTKDM